LYAEEFIASSQTDPAPLVEIIEQDPSVSVNVLRRVNSAYYGVRREVESIDQAVRLLGCVEISSIVLIQGVNEFQEHFSSHSSLLRQIAHTAIFTGRFGQRLCSALDVPPDWTRRAFLSGFICATARLILLHMVPDRYEALVERSETSLPTAEAEEHVFGASHRTLAPTAADHWELPERICETLQVAAEPTDEADGPKRVLAASIRTGSFLSRQDLEDEPLIPENGLEQIHPPAQEELVTEAAQDASTYAAEVGHF